MTSAPRSATAALKTQYMALYAHKDCALITVKELCAAAGVARTTFYAHYDTTDDIKKEIEDELISGLLLVTEKAAAGDLPSMDFVPFLDEIQSYIRAHWEAFRAFLVVQPNARFIAAWKESIKQNFARRYPHKRHIPNYALVSEIVGSAAIGAYTYWLSNPDGVRTDDIKPLIDRTLSAITAVL